jgi:hypothetical protein
MRVAVFTDNDFDKMNGVTTTLRSVLRYAPADVRPRVYTFSGLEVDEPEYLALHSTGFPIPVLPPMGPGRANSGRKSSAGTVSSGREH